jgi:hypothetical protein
MADSVNERDGAGAGADVDAAEVVERAARLANEMSETPGDAALPGQAPAGPPRGGVRRLADPLAEAAQSAARVTGRGMRATGRGVRAARRGVSGGSGWLAAQVVAMAPRLRVRNQATLREQFPGRSAEEIADALIDGAARASAAVGGAVGVWSALPAPPAWPAEVATETLALVGIEIKLVAELHEAYGMPAPGNTRERMSAYVGAWARRRGVSLAPEGLLLAAGSPLARRLRWRLAARAGRGAFSLSPLLTGAAAGALLNRRETRRLGQDVRDDLRRRLPAGPWAGQPQVPPPARWET